MIVPTLVINLVEKIQFIQFTPTVDENRWTLVTVVVHQTCWWGKIEFCLIDFQAYIFTNGYL